MGRATTHPLRLRSAADHTEHQPITSQATDELSPHTLNPTDPRWVLAMRVRESMQGVLLPADRRDRLLKIGQLLGLTAFESNLVIAIVQDQTRRGGSLGDAVGSLNMVPRHGLQTASLRLKHVGWLVAATIALEIALMLWLFA